MRWLVWLGAGFVGASPAFADRAAPVSPPPASLAEGAQIYRHVCQGCHMPDAHGASGAAAFPALAGNPRLASSGYPVLVVLNGLGGMPWFANQLDDRQVASVVNFVRTHFGNGYTDPVAAADVAAVRVPIIDEDGPRRSVPRRDTSKGAIVPVVATAPAPGQTTEASGVIRHPAGKFPIAAEVEVPRGMETVYLSGMGADVADPKAPPFTFAAYGDTETQTASALGKIRTALAGLGLGPGNVVNMHVYLAADPKLGHMDFTGMMRAYTKMFGTSAQPELPTRSAFQVAALANPGWLVEIEVTAVRRPH